MKASRPLDETMVAMLKADPEFAAVYLAAALDEADQPGGQLALLAALRQIAEAQCMASVAERAGIPRESLYRALSPRGNPTLKTLLALLNATGLRLGCERLTGSRGMQTSPNNEQRRWHECSIARTQA
jgi:probable addiction module antidote protein